MDTENTTTTIEWFDLIVIMNSLIASIEETKRLLSKEGISEDQEYQLEEELEDYINVITKIKTKYFKIGSKGELPELIIKRINNL
jgi:RNA polymerase subunit RPABC4/transcription elongation factor Spt4